MKNEQRDRRELFIDSIQAIAEHNTGVRPSRKQVDKFVGVPGELKPGSPPWMKPLQAEYIIKQN
jgi:hypothetical protein